MQVKYHKNQVISSGDVNGPDMHGDTDHDALVCTTHFSFVVCYPEGLWQMSMKMLKT